MSDARSPSSTFIPALSDPHSPPPSSPKRQVFSGEEYGEISVPLELVLKESALDIYKSVLGKGFFRIQLHKNRLVFQAGGFLGLFPLNDSVALEVRARVPIGNLERILFLAPDYIPQYLPEHLQLFSTGPVSTPSLLDVLAVRLVQVVKQICVEGLHYEYRERTHLGSMPRGRLLPFASAEHQVRARQRLEVAFSAFERTYDTPLNRCLRLAIRRLLHIFRGMKNRRGTKKVESNLAIADTYFRNVAIDHSMQFLADPRIYDSSLLPSSKLSYGPAMPTALAILHDQGIRIRHHDGDLILPSVLVSMERAFEAYLRSVLKFIHRDCEGVTVLDGNHAPHSGGRRALFDGDNSCRMGRATPDVVIRKQGLTELLIDAKYKRFRGRPDREDINQVLVYGLVYRCKRVALAYPHRSSTTNAIQRIGVVGGIELFIMLIDLGASDLEGEERLFVAATSSLLGLV